MRFRQREMLGFWVGLAVSVTLLTVSVVITGLYENLEDRVLPFILAPGSGTIGFIVGFLIADGRSPGEILRSLSGRGKGAEAA